jgi:hypothetical protein
VNFCGWQVKNVLPFGTAEYAIIQSLPPESQRVVRRRSRRILGFGVWLPAFRVATHSITGTFGEISVQSFLIVSGYRSRSWPSCTITCWSWVVMTGGWFSLLSGWLGVEVEGESSILLILVYSLGLLVIVDPIGRRT